MRPHTFLGALAVSLFSSANAQVVGSAFGMAAGTTGGGSVTPAAPSSLAQLVQWLGDSTPRVILINREWNFIGYEGSATSAGCELKACTVANGGQNFIGTLSCGGTNVNPISSIRYDVAGTRPIRVASNKSLVGVGSTGVIRGKGLNLNVWGGDGITLQNTNRIWIDHCKFSLVGRQFIVSGWDPAGRVTISNNEFDGNSQWSSACNRQHYWALLLIGAKDLFTFSGNWLHHISGRAPHFGTTQNGATNVFHCVNNLFENMDGHALDIEAASWSLIEGNVFKGVKQSITPASTTGGANVYIPTNGAACSSYIGRACQLNSLSSSSSLPGSTNTAALSRLASDGGSNIAPARAVSGVEAWVKSNAGIGKLGSGSPPTTTPPTVPPPSGGSPLYGQCGGIGWTGPTTCAQGTCKYSNDWYSQCL